MSQSVTPDKRVAMAIMKLATATSLHYIRNQFNMASCMAKVAIHEVCQVLQDIAANNFLCLHNPMEVVEGFKAMAFPKCMGALDSTHPRVIPITSEPVIHKQEGIWVLQAMVNHQGYFTNIYTGWTGSVHDVHVVRNSSLPCMMKKGQYVPGVPDRVIWSVAMPLLIIADVAYPLQPWLMKPYGEHITDPQKMAFNYCLSECRMTVECTFGHLKEIRSNLE
ncbi:hypothetical protein Y1Q_0006420 [Alligator mississippiensis]|uniref:DDE Tnp4 domain-containing protein n=1 Tax=Alligator mississippiensis TaxID=8496 RepID=A0A151NYK3_ALLMI|nr:hypothetical protein Y1Q_0006420 [Alligator mississippiensis]